MIALKAYLWLLAVLTLSGLLLMLFYVPSAVPVTPSAAGAGVSAGSVLRGIHFWAAQFAVLAVLAHLGNTIFVRTNRPRTIGTVILVLMTGLLWFTGFLLPWDQLASWMQQLWLPNISAQNALWSVYWTHTLVLSLLMLLFLFVYVRRTRLAQVASA